MVDPAQRPAPSATGTLATTPLAHALVYARNRRLTGIFELRSPTPAESRGAIAFWRGRITDVRTTPPLAYFGAVAYELGHIDADTMNATLLEVAQKKRRHGEILVERKAMTAAQRDEVLAEQACRKVHHLFSFPAESEFAFYEAKPADGEPDLALDPLAPIWRGIREHPPDASVHDVLARYRGSALKLVNEAPIAAVGFVGDEALICKALASRPLTPAQMRTLTSIDGTRVDLLAYLLVIGKCVEPVAIVTARPSVEAMPSVSTPSSASMPVARPSVSMPSMPTPSSASIPAPRPSVSMPTPSSASMPVARATGMGIPSPANAWIPSGAPSISSGRPSGSMPAATPPGGIPASGPRTFSASGLPAQRPGRPSMSFKSPSSSSMAAAGATAQPGVTEVTAQLGPAELGPTGIATRAQSIEQEDYFEALGVPDGASVEAVRAAYFRLAKLWHPDKLPADLAPFQQEAERIFSHMTRAQRTLTDPEARRGWLATRAERNAVVHRPRHHVMRDIDLGLTRRDFVFVEDEARRLFEQDGEDAEAQALVAWAQAHAGDAPEDILRTSILALDKAVNKDRYCERAYFYRGMLNKRVGNSAMAFRDFARTVQINPKHTDAEREVRVFEMRARKGSGEHALGSLLSKAKTKK